MRTLTAFCLVFTVQSQINFSTKGDQPQAGPKNPSSINFERAGSKYKHTTPSKSRPTPTRANLIKFPIASSTNETRLDSVNAAGQINCKEDSDCPRDHFDTKINKVAIHACAVQDVLDDGTPLGICVEDLFPTAPSTNESRLFSLNAEGHIECQEQSDCPQEYFDTEDKLLVRYYCIWKSGIAREDESKVCSESEIDPLSEEPPPILVGTSLAFVSGTAGQGILNLGGVHRGQQGSAHQCVESLIDFHHRLSSKATLQIPRRALLQDGRTWKRGKSACLSKALLLDLLAKLYKKEDILYN